MAIYNLECKNCSSVDILNISIKKYIESCQKDGLNQRHCKACNKLSEFTRIFSASSSKIERDKEEMMRQVKEESRKIVQSIKSGNAKAIRNIYGEE
jgi:hypothetical protein